MLSHEKKAVLELMDSTIRKRDKNKHTNPKTTTKERWDSVYIVVYYPIEIRDRLYLFVIVMISGSI